MLMLHFTHMPNQSPNQFNKLSIKNLINFTLNATIVFRVKIISKNQIDLTNRRKIVSIIFSSNIKCFFLQYI